MLRKIKKGIIAVDRGGSKGNYPIAIVSAYSDKITNFERVVKEIKSRFKIPYEKIKGKDFDKRTHEKIIETIFLNNIKFNIYIVEGKLYERIKNLISSYNKKWEQILEAILWYKSLDLLIKKIAILPEEIVYEKTYNKDGVFDNVFKKLILEKFGLKEVEVGSKFSSYIMVVDWLANFFHKNAKLREKYKEQVIKCDLKFIESTLWKYVKKKEQIQSTHGWRNNRWTHADRTINMISESIFKVFGYLKIIVLTGHATLGMNPVSLNNKEPLGFTKFTISHEYPMVQLMRFKFFDCSANKQ